MNHLLKPVEKVTIAELADELRRTDRLLELAWAKVSELSRRRAFLRSKCPHESLLFEKGRTKCKVCGEALE